MSKLTEEKVESWLQEDAETISRLRAENEKMRELLERVSTEMEQAMNCNEVACPVCQTDFIDVIGDISKILSPSQREETK